MKVSTGGQCDTSASSRKPTTDNNNRLTCAGQKVSVMIQLSSYHQNLDQHPRWSKAPSPSSCRTPTTRIHRPEALPGAVIEVVGIASAYRACPGLTGTIGVVGSPHHASRDACRVDTHILHPPPCGRSCALCEEFCSPRVVVLTRCMWCVRSSLGAVAWCGVASCEASVLAFPPLRVVIAVPTPSGHSIPVPSCSCIRRHGSVRSARSQAHSVAVLSP